MPRESLYFLHPSLSLITRTRLSFPRQNHPRHLLRDVSVCTARKIISVPSLLAKLSVSKKSKKVFGW